MGNVHSITEKLYSYYAELSSTAQLTRAVQSEVIHLLTEGIRPKQDFICQNYGITRNQLDKMLRPLKDDWITWKNGNGNRRHSFKLLRLPKLPAIRYTDYELYKAGSHRQAAANRFINVICHGELPTFKRLAEVLGCSDKTARNHLKPFKQSPVDNLEPCGKTGGTGGKSGGTGVVKVAAPISYVLDNYIPYYLQLTRPAVNNSDILTPEEREALQEAIQQTNPIPEHQKPQKPPTASYLGQRL